MEQKKETKEKTKEVKKNAPSPLDKWKSTGGASVPVDLSKVEFVNRPTEEK